MRLFFFRRLLTDQESRQKPVCRHFDLVTLFVFLQGEPRETNPDRHKAFSMP